MENFNYLIIKPKSSSKLIASLMKAKMLSLKKRKACIKKKTMELSVLCDVECCVVMVDDDGSVETWPENQKDVIKIIEKYDDVDDNNMKKKKKKIGESLEELLRMVETKLEALDRRIEVVKNPPNDNHKGKDKILIRDAKQGFLSIQTFHQTPCEQDSLNQQQLATWDNNSSSASTSEQGFLSMQTLLCEKESSNQDQHVFDNNNPSASSEQILFNYYMQPLQINNNQPALLQTPFLSGQESNHQIMYYFPVGVYQLPLHQFTANGLFPGRSSN